MDGTHVKIGPIVYAIERVEKLYDDENGQELLGWYRESLSTIQLDSAMPAPLARVVLWHEIVHAIFAHSGHEQSEPLCNAIGYAITQILADNPWLGNTKA